MEGPSGDCRRSIEDQKAFLKSTECDSNLLNASIATRQICAKTLIRMVSNGYASGMTRRHGRSSRSIMLDNTKGKTKAAIQTGKSIVKPVVIAAQASANLSQENFLLCALSGGDAGWVSLLLISRRELRCHNREYDPHSRLLGLLRRHRPKIGTDGLSSCRPAPTTVPQGVAPQERKCA